MHANNLNCLQKITIPELYFQLYWIIISGGENGNLDLNQKSSAFNIALNFRTLIIDVLSITKV